MKTCVVCNDEISSKERCRRMVCVSCAKEHGLKASGLKKNKDKGPQEKPDCIESTEKWERCLEMDAKLLERCRRDDENRRLRASRGDESTILAEENRKAKKAEAYARQKKSDPNYTTNFFRDLYRAKERELGRPLKDTEKEAIKENTVRNKKRPSSSSSAESRTKKKPMKQNDFKYFVI